MGRQTKKMRALENTGDWFTTLHHSTSVTAKPLANKLVTPALVCTGCLQTGRPHRCHHDRRQWTSTCSSQNTFTSSAPRKHHLISLYGQNKYQVWWASRVRRERRQILFSSGSSGTVISRPLKYLCSRGLLPSMTLAHGQIEHTQRDIMDWPSTTQQLYMNCGQGHNNKSKSEESIKQREAN